MIAHSNKQIEVELMPHLHLELHSSALLEDPPTSHNHSEVMSAESRLGIRGMVVGKPSRSQDHVDWDPTLKTLLAESEVLEFAQPVLLGCAVDHRVPEDDVVDASVVDCRLTRPAATGFGGVCVLETPGVSTLVVEETREVVTLVQELENAREYLRLSGLSVSRAGFGKMVDS